MPDQFKNPANPEIHFRTTGPEIWEQTEGQIDVLVSGVGTGGTISGISRFIKKEKKRALLSVAVEPRESPVITQRLAGQEIKPGPHKIQGIGAGFIEDPFEEGPAEVSLPGIRQNDHNRSALESLLAGYPEGHRYARPAGNPGKDPFLPRQPAGVLDGLIAGDLFDPVDEGKVEGVGDESGTNALDLVGARFDFLPRQALGDDRAFPGFHGHAEESVFLLLLDELGNPGDRAPGADAGD